MSNTETSKMAWLDNLDLVKKKISKKISDEDFKMFMYIAKKHEFDPLMGEIWATPTWDKQTKGYKHQTVVGREGIRKAARKSSVYDGCVLEDIERNGELCIQATVWRKDMSHPIKPTPVRLSEYSTGKSLWASKPNTMLSKVAEAQALRMAFDLEGLYVQEEFDKGNSMARGEREDAPEINPEKKSPPNAPETTPKAQTDSGAVSRIEKARDVFTKAYHAMEGEKKMKFGKSLADITRKYTDYKENPETAKKVLDEFGKIAKEYEIK